MAGNFAELILGHADRAPDRAALVLPKGWEDGTQPEQERWTFGQLAHEVARYRAGFADRGFGPGDRVILMFPVCIELYALVLALLASGMAVVLIDTGMGRTKILQAIEDSSAKAIISVDALLKFRWVLPKLWRLKKFSVDSSGLFLSSLSALRGDPQTLPPPVDRQPDDHALITFTSGSTGRPKGADRTHALLTAQHHALADHFPEQSDEVDMPCFPVVTLHNLCCGITTVLPPVDFGAVAAVQPDIVWSWATSQGVTRMSGAPAYIEPLIAALEAGTKPPPTLRALGVGGARVPVSLCERTLAALPQRECKVLYGSTEAEPIASASFQEVVTDRGEGVLVGHEASAAEIALVDLPTPTPALDERGLAPYRVAHGELLVRGPHVNRRYLDNPEADRLNKLPEADGTVWHRTGDLARRDDRGRLWLTGRLKDLVRLGDRSIHPFPLEEAGDALQGVRRCALVDAGGPRFVLTLQHDANKTQVEADAKRLLVERELGDIPIEFVEHIPLDRRHNSKIDRPALRASLAN